MLPHLVLDGLATAAMAVGAKNAYLCVHDHEADLLDSLDDAVAERDDPVRVRVTGVPGRYVASEQSSIVQYLNGGPAKPTFAPPRPQERGVRGLPTLVNNVETLAHLALIARYGDRWFRSAGLPGRAWLDAGHRERGGLPAGCLRDRARHPGRGRGDAGGRSRGAATGSAGRRLFRCLAAG